MSATVGLDTCVVLRLLTGSPEDQFARAHRFLDECAADGVRVLVNDLVVAEVYHALLHFYDVPTHAALDALRSFLSSPGIQATGNAATVLATYRGSGAGLVDRLIRADLLRHTDRLVSFDKDFCKLPDVTRL